MLGNAMINRIKALFADDREVAVVDGGASDKHLAAAVLLVEAAFIDENFEAAERDAILDIVQRRFELSAGEAASLLEAAQRMQRDAHDLVRFTRAIKQNFDHAERIELMEMLWEVVYADGRVDAFEANLLRRIGGLIYVSDRDRGAAHKRVAARLASGGRRH
jgi:uncharacterized tellurite resistance protein B-like protein